MFFFVLDALLGRKSTIAFRKVVKVNIGEQFNVSCRLVNDTPTAWYNISGTEIQSQNRRHVSKLSTVLGDELLLTITKVVPSDAGVYVCKGRKKEGIFVVYVLGEIPTSCYPVLSCLVLTSNDRSLLLLQYIRRNNVQLL